MHICLLPAETLLDIFATIHEDCDKPISCATLAALARTCRKFKEPALDMLWKQIDGFGPLISCFPEGVSNRDVQGNLTLIRPPFIREWRIFTQYAHRVRSLSFNPSKLDAIDDRVVQALISAPSPTLLPNLCRLQWLDNRECFTPLLRCLLVPSIRSIELGTILSSHWVPSFAKSTLLTSLSARCPSIRELECIYGFDSEDSSSDAISDAVCGLRELIHLTVGVLDTRALLHLASLPSLKSLYFRTHDIDNTQTNATPTFASQIDRVHILVPSLLILARCLRNIRFLSCRSVFLVIDDSNSALPYDPLLIPEIIASFSECFSPALEQFSFDFDFEHHLIALADPRFVLAFDAVAPLLPFSRLTKLDLDWICTSAIDDALLRRMTQSWPLLQEFRFGSGSCWSVPPSLTFIGLTYLIQHCRGLRTIEMTFCACSVDTNSEPFSKTIPNENVTRIFVGMSPIVDSIAVACQLHTLLPKLITVDRFGLLKDLRSTPQFQCFDEEWARVDEFLVVLTTSAEMKENIGQAPQCSLSP
ncbi:hypothetical protein DEU56DRAFT_747157 [Suillus clintonianus]|uniref:uncharacterized protein n=1 Tax=Suillus clintonianus TaxID=1904413 RepID=UPI001B87FC72|nr:uncharacterized protein DEU56DRAFT_747157 [Suillus clintonianus]KAG2120030.1 hypothetical protein DEU56DRAFT_747157 [Suillus clintonianus]